FLQLNPAAGWEMAPLARVAQTRRSLPCLRVEPGIRLCCTWSATTHRTTSASSPRAPICAGNPVERGLVASPEQRLWSSFRHNHLEDDSLPAADRLPQTQRRHTTPRLRHPRVLTGKRLLVPSELVKSS